MGKAWVNGKPFSFRSAAVNSIDDLRVPVDGTDCEIVQLGSGRFAGRLTRASIGDLAFSLGSFSLPIRATGVLSGTRLTIGALLRSAKPVKSWSGTLHPGSIIVFPPGADHYTVYPGSAAFAALSLDSIELAMILGHECELSDPDCWSRGCRATGRCAADRIEQRLLLIMAQLAKQDTLTPSLADFLKRSVVDTFAVHLLDMDGASPAPVIASTFNIVKDAENYVDLRAHRAVHISEICTSLNISRRTLHRAFDDVLGIGPSAFLRQKRLCSVHSALRRLDPRETRVTEVATEFGFLELGRFSQYYRRLFGEYPNETLRRAAH
jgi:AraC family ethanolamine operon transcriptional activator